jgi:O-methyltransferase involved in polyketide biosynthesis
MLSTGWESGYKRFVATGVWLFGLEPEDCPTFLQGYGWRIIEEVGYEELAVRYLGPTGRQLASTPWRESLPHRRYDIGTTPAST